jgi:hypothetical protein
MSRPQADRLESTRLYTRPSPGGRGLPRLVVVHDQERSDGPRQSWIVPRIESVVEWLDEYEAEHAGLTPLQEEFKKALEEKRRGDPGD